MQMCITDGVLGKSILRYRIKNNNRIIERSNYVITRKSNDSKKKRRKTLILNCVQKGRFRNK